MNTRSTSSTHRYMELASTLRNRVMRGAYGAGSKLPSESELVAETGYSRSTIRHALKVLTDEGLIMTRRGSGSFVTYEAKQRSEELEFSSYTQMMSQCGLRAKTRTVDALTSRAAGATAKFFQIPPGSPLVKLVRMRYLDEKPLCLETTYLMAEFSTLVDEDLDGSLYALLKDRFGREVGHGHKTFEVCFAKQNEAFLLDVPRNTALMLITDYVYDAHGEPLHVSKRVQRTDRAKYVEPIG